MNKDCNICVLGGGWSNEREISLKSGEAILQSLLKNSIQEKYPHFCNILYKL